MAGTVVVGASLAQRPFAGGHAWAILQYVLGFRRLGFDVLLVDRLEPEMCHDAAGRPCPVERSVNLAALLAVVRRFGLDGRVAVLHDRGARVIGMSRRALVERVRDSALVLNVMGFLDDEEVLGAAPLRVFLDIDPGFGQLWRELGLADVFAGHDRFVTIGERIGARDCAIPTCGLDWITTPQPVVLDQWDAGAPAGRAYTTVATWRGPFGPIEHGGRTYGLRVHQFRRFAELPGLTAAPLEVALDIDPAERRDLDLLGAHGWRLVEPRTVAGTPEAYRRYVTASRGELSIAKGLYVDTRGGWFSDRSICYLAAGRPVVAQDTGFSAVHPTGEGLLAFTTLDEARAALEEADADWSRHSRAARALAEAEFGSDVVLSRLLSRVGAG